GLIAGFVIAESSVSEEIRSYQAAATDESMEAVFRAQERDEERHARFFDLVAADVAGVPGADAAARRDAPRAHVRPELVEPFEPRPPSTPRRPAERHGALTHAAGLSH